MGLSLTHAIASRNAPNELTCGDCAAVLPGSDHTLFVVADGVGHGPDARLAALRATEVAAANVELPLDRLMEQIDRALASTRGAAISLVRIGHTTAQMDFVGIGNVECRARSAKPIQPLTMPGIVGRGLRRVRTWSFPVAPGDVVVLYTDGISSRMELDPVQEPTRVVSGVLTHARGTDDALVLAIRVDA